MKRSERALLHAMSAYSGRVRSGGAGEFITTVDASRGILRGREQRRFLKLTAITFRPALPSKQALGSMAKREWPN